jgi:hypothetical protein
LQFIFEKCEANEFFPLGVKFHYRAYSADSVIEIVNAENLTFVADSGATSQILTGCIPIRTIVTSNPPGKSIFKFE